MMNAENSIPPLRDLPPGRLAQRAQQLRAEIDRPRRRPYVLAVALAIAVLAVVLATPAFGLQSHIVQLFASSKPPPERIHDLFADAAQPAPGETRKPDWVLVDKRRVAVTLRIPGYGTERLWVAPTRNGGLCVGTPDGCDRYRRRPFFTTLTASPSTQRNGHIFFLGDTLAHGARILIRFEDGSSDRIPLTWVSRPIDAGVFLYDLPRVHWKKGRMPIVLTVENANGQELARSTKAPEYLRELQDEGVAPP
jgi:hypothetical protein